MVMQSYVIIFKDKTKKKKSQGTTEMILQRTSSGTVYMKYSDTSLPISDPSLTVDLGKF